MRPTFVSGNSDVQAEGCSLHPFFTEDVKRSDVNDREPRASSQKSLKQSFLCECVFGLLSIGDTDREEVLEAEALSL